MGSLAEMRMLAEETNDKGEKERDVEKEKGGAGEKTRPKDKEIILVKV